uniref:hypothetical protein n=1 Tax=Campylobacter coli TaxID=195 RepID=UPI000B2DD586
HKNLNQKSNIKESINFKELSLNSNQENNTKQSNTIIDDIKEDFNLISNNAIINNTNFKGKKIA